MNYPYRCVLGCVCKPNRHRAGNIGDFHTALRKAHLEFESSVCEVKGEKKKVSVYAFDKQQDFFIVCISCLWLFGNLYLTKIPVVAQPLLNIKLCEYQNSVSSLLPALQFFDSLLLPCMTKVSSLSPVSFHAFAFDQSTTGLYPSHSLQGLVSPWISLYRYVFIK